MTLIIIFIAAIAAFIFLGFISSVMPNCGNKDVVFIDTNTGNVISDADDSGTHMYDDHSSFSCDFGTVASIFENDLFDDM
ncbi:MAG: hypothetical protein ACI936_000018 [Paraglaciecola sp.]|jgi:hypothetical protein